MNRIICGDSLTILKTLDSESVDCCITSPPYWGLRDYGTAKWEGRTPDCDHKIDPGKPRKQTTNAGTIEIQFKEICQKCGAKRTDNQLGLEKTPEEYVAKMVEVFGEVKRVLKKEGTLWLNLGDSYAGNREKATGSATAICGNTKLDICAKVNKVVEGLKPKDLVGIPWRCAFALQADGWYLRQDIIWAKPNPMPESVTDRCTKSHEYIFMLAKSQKYYFDDEAIKEKYTAPMNRWGGQKLKADGESAWDKGTGQSTYRDRDMRPDPEGRNKRSVWTVTTKPFKGAHFATFPEDLILPCVLAGCPKDGIVLDPFFGAGTTGVVAKKNNRNYIGIELNPKYIEMAQRRIDNTMGTML